MKNQFYEGNMEALNAIKVRMQSLNDVCSKDWAVEQVEANTNAEANKSMAYFRDVYTMAQIKDALQHHFPEDSIISVARRDEFVVSFSSLKQPIGTCTLDMLRRDIMSPETYKAIVQKNIAA